LLNVASGFLKPDSGRCLLDGREISHQPPHLTARLGVSRTFQELRVISNAPVLENVLLACPNQKGEKVFSALFWGGRRNEESKNIEKAIWALDLVGLTEQRDRMACQLSYGQQKLLTLACCLAMEGRVLLLDEPVSGVHPDLAQEILAILRSIADQDKVVVIVEHDLVAVRRVAKRVVVMDSGCVVADGATETVLELPEVLEAYVGQ
ncbi:MAG: ABC transporter ATP-binding protein, partial [bacterium]|nr:ABC transporter ATP-binding protein [bacterium]